MPQKEDAPYLDQEIAEIQIRGDQARGPTFDLLYIYWLGIRQPQLIPNPNAPGSPAKSGPAPECFVLVHAQGGS